VARYLLGLLALALVVTACGGKHPATPPLSPGAFRAEADRVCERAKTHAGRLAGLRKLRPPLADEDLYAHWLKAERDAIEAAKPPRHTSAQPLFDSRIALTVAEGKIAGYARRLGAARCV